MRGARAGALVLLAISVIFLAWSPEPDRAPTPPPTLVELAFTEATIPVAEWVQPPVVALPVHEPDDPVPTTAAPVATTAPPPPPSTVPTTAAPEPTTAPSSPATVAPTTTTTEPETTTTTEPEPADDDVIDSGPVLGGGWELLRRCESGGNYGTHTGNGYSGAYQFDQPTWDGVVRRLGRRDLVGVPPASASPADQDLAAAELYAERGAQPWPVCGRYL